MNLDQMTKARTAPRHPSAGPIPVARLAQGRRGLPPPAAPPGPPQPAPHQDSVHASLERERDFFQRLNDGLFRVAHKYPGLSRDIAELIHRHEDACPAGGATEDAQ